MLYCRNWFSLNHLKERREKKMAVRQVFELIKHQVEFGVKGVLTVPKITHWDFGRIKKIK